MILISVPLLQYK